MATPTGLVPTGIVATTVLPGLAITETLLETVFATGSSGLFLDGYVK